jgi:hypothetical protein
MAGMPATGKMRAINISKQQHIVYTSNGWDVSDFKFASDQWRHYMPGMLVIEYCHNNKLVKTPKLL